MPSAGQAAVTQIVSLVREAAGPELTTVIREWISERLSRQGIDVDLTELVPEEVRGMLEEAIEQLKKNAARASDEKRRAITRTLKATRKRLEATTRKLNESEAARQQSEAARDEMVAELERLRKQKNSPSV